jgi:hypothetical protein
MKTMRWYSLLLLALALAVLPAGPSGAASKSGKGAPPVIDAFYVDPPNQVTPGTELVFTVEGTAKGKVSVRIAGVPRVITLKEADAGVYEGSYTIRTRDKVAPDTTARASLKVRGRTTSAELAFSATPPAPPPVAQPAAPAPPPAAAARIDRFAVAPIAKIEPGADLKFTLTGTPGAKASLAIEGVAKDVPLREVKSGQYEGSYTIRRLDAFPAAVNVTASLESGGQTARTKLDQSLLVDAKPPVLRNQSPRDGETVPLGQVSISATFDDSGGLGVDPKSVRITLDTKDLTPNSTVSPQFFTFRGDVPPGSHHVQIVARDLAGNTMRQGWNFTVGQPAAAALPLQIVSHQNNALIAGGATEVRGRTAPGAEIDVKVTQTASVAGLFGVNQEVLNQKVRADANVNFAFKFQPPISVPGSRYEIALKARSGQASRDTQLVLFQQK